MWERSTLDVGEVDYEELAFYVGKYSPRELIVKSHLEEYTYTKKKRIYKKKKVARKFNRKLHIKIRKQKNSVDQDATMSPSQSHIPCMQNPDTEFNKKVKKNKKSDWEKPKKTMTERKKLFGLSLQTLILTCMKNHLYQFKGNVRLQKAGGPTGLDLTGELADLFMLWWDQEFLAILEKLSIDTDVYTRFKDDIDLVCDALPSGGKYIKEHCDIIFENETFNDTPENERKYLSLEKIYENKKKENYEANTMKVLNEIANSIHPMIELTSDMPSNYSDGKLPVLDLKVKLGPKNQIDFEFYEKQTKNNRLFWHLQPYPGAKRRLYL